MITIIIYNKNQMDIIDKENEQQAEIVGNIEDFTIKECMKVFEETDD